MRKKIFALRFDLLSAFYNFALYLQARITDQDEVSTYSSLTSCGSDGMVAIFWKL